MAQAWAKQFYRSKRWWDCRRHYIARVNGLCERCLATKGEHVPGYIVHHKVVLTPMNIDDPAISLNPDLLYYVCFDCHEAEHKHGATREDVTFDINGRLIKR